MLEMKNVTKTFGNFKALDDLTLTVPSGRVYGLVGPNGAGKSTAIRHLTGVYRPDSGSVTMDGQPIYENPAVKAAIGYIPDEIFYYPSATLEDMRKFYRGIYPTFDDALFDKLYDVFQLPKRTPIRRFSKGMQKQAAFHLTICTRPKTLILDEPVDGLDPVMRRQVMGLILSDVAGHGTTVLISSHNLRELEDVCDYVGIMNRGKMLLEKSLADMQGSTVKLQLVGDAPQELDILNATVSGRLKTLIVRGEAEEVGAKMAACKPAYFDVLPLSLEEIFIYELGGVDYEIKDMVAVSLVATRFDVLGIEDRIPDVEDVSSVTLNFDGLELTSEEDIRRITTLHAMALEDRIESYGDYPLAYILHREEKEKHPVMPEGGFVYGEGGYNADGPMLTTDDITIYYKLKNGCTMTRNYNIWANLDEGKIVKEYASRWEQVWKQAQYGYQDGFNPEDITSMNIGDMTHQITPELVESLLAAVKADCDERTMTQRSAYHLGYFWDYDKYNEEYYKTKSLTISLWGENDVYATGAYLSVFADSAHTLEWMREHDCLTEEVVEEAPIVLN